MFIKRRKGWEIPEREATPESVFLNRRQILAGGGYAAGTLALPGSAQASGGVQGLIDTFFGTAPTASKEGESADPSFKYYPFRKNPKYKLDRELTPEDVNASYNNFYEFGSHKRIARAAQALPIRPWEITLDGLVEEEKVVGIDDLLDTMPLEERLYRHRCVEAWSMTIPWSGFAMRELVKLAKPLSSAKYVRM